MAAVGIRLVGIRAGGLDKLLGSKNRKRRRLGFLLHGKWCRDIPSPLPVDIIQVADSIGVRLGISR
jgi:hypothetical protein